MDEIKQIELETARLKLERERMAYEDELKKRERAEQAKETAIAATAKAKSMLPKLLRWAIYLGALWLGAMGLIVSLSGMR